MAVESGVSIRDNTADERRHPSHQPGGRASTVVFLTAEELERRQAYMAELDRITRRRGPVEPTSDDLLTTAYYDVDFGEVEFTAAERERRQKLADEADASEQLLAR